MATETYPTSHAESVRKLADRMAKDIAIACGVTVGVAVLVAVLWEGLPGLVGALVGGAIATASAMGTVVLMRRTRALEPMMVMVIALAGYVGKIIILFVVMTLLKGVDGLHTMSVAVTMMAVILVAAGAEMRAFKKTKTPTLIVSEGEDRP
ncbi:hypothetical protein [Actinokineospora sp. UTMC 2448]|uniref:hypothetical protein n=1 Tax=Actinokineospora sp. UTMC 2448 TaxID=2268449 RepID=UPI002164D176|nr:hypothetical protein [Actinokineospora sp. UTMC 2448]UVS81385.1 hypothetical protein Actkin_05142 [Actinokineospora sp. UTMC 2448]